MAVYRREKSGGFDLNFAVAEFKNLLIQAINTKQNRSKLNAKPIWLKDTRVSDAKPLRFDLTKPYRDSSNGRSTNTDPKRMKPTKCIAVR